VQYVDGHFVEAYYPTIENTFSKIVRYRNQDYAVEIVDTAGQDESGNQEAQFRYATHLIGIHGYMIVFSLDRKQSWRACESICERILAALGADSVPVVLVGNKSDVRPEQRQVTVEDIAKVRERLAQIMGMGEKQGDHIPYVEASARYNLNVSKAFETLVAVIEKSREDVKPKDAGSKCSVM